MKEKLLKQYTSVLQVSAIEDVNNGKTKPKIISRGRNSAEIVVKFHSTSLTFHLQKHDSKWMACVGYEVWRDERTKKLTKVYVTKEIKFA